LGWVIKAFSHLRFGVASFAMSKLKASPVLHRPFGGACGTSETDPKTLAPDFPVSFYGDTLNF
ncbi:MAG: hypothetical protein LBT78_08135, partial [Tannerella sp.]|nr:hypothetical protein [Tannerella sp.]